jgi:hypothetical protein
VKMLHRVLEQVLWIDGIGSVSVQEVLGVVWRSRIGCHDRSWLVSRYVCIGGF